MSGTQQQKGWEPLLYTILQQCTKGCDTVPKFFIRIKVSLGKKCDLPSPIVTDLIHKSQPSLYPGKEPSFNQSLINEDLIHKSQI